jgi:hypothetical protein
MILYKESNAVRQIQDTGMTSFNPFNPLVICNNSTHYLLEIIIELR